MKNLNIQLFESVTTLIQEAQKQVVRNVNTTMLYTYFNIGRMIIEEEQLGEERAAYSKTIIKDLSSYLTKEFGKGFSKRNLEYFRRFYLLYRSRIAQTVFAQFKLTSSRSPRDIPTSVFSEVFHLSWSHYVELMKIDNDQERSFYEIEAASNNWSIREFQRQYSSSLYKRIILNKEPSKVKRLSKEGQILESPLDALKTPFVLEFLNLNESPIYSESDL